MTRFLKTPTDNLSLNKNAIALGAVLLKKIMPTGIFNDTSQRVVLYVIFLRHILN